LPGFIGPGLRLRYLHPSGRIIRTSRVLVVKKVSSAVVISREAAGKQGCGDDRKDGERGGRA
jgi:hypothetical protein